MADLEKIIKVTQAQYDILASGGKVGDYVGLQDNYIYMIEDANEYITTDKVVNLGYYDTITQNSDETYTITRQTGYLVLDGVKNKFNAKSATTNNGAFTNDTIINNYVLKPTDNNTVADVICNRFGTYATNVIYTTNIYGISVRNNGSLFIGLTTAIDTLDKANAWLIQNPISIQYKLATATTEKVEKNHYARYNAEYCKCAHCLIDI